MKLSLVASSILLLAFSFGLSASPSFQPPVPILKENIVRLALGPAVATNFTNGLGYIGGGVGATFNAGNGFYVGVELSGFYVGVNGKGMGGLFQTPAPTRIVPGLINVMARYLGSITEVFSLGTQVSANYQHLFSMNTGSPTSVVGDIGNFGLSAGIPFSFSWEAASFYFMPEFDVAIIGKKTQTTSATADTAGMPGGQLLSTLGGSFRVGALIALGTPLVSLLLEAKPWVGDFTKLKIAPLEMFNQEFTAGVAFNL